MNRLTLPISSPTSTTSSLLSTHSSRLSSGSTTTSVALGSIHKATNANLQTRLQQSADRLMTLEIMVYITIILTAAILFAGGQPVIAYLILAALACYMVKSYLDSTKIQAVAQRALSQV